CTGPILGTLLGTVLDSNAGPMQLTAGIAGFGVALGLPFGFFAAFPSWMSNFPKSGGWMTTVKVVLGFIELALALKFLSNADLVKHWGLLKIEPFLALWILIALAMGVYLLGKIRFPHDSPLKKLSPARLGFAVASFGFAAYLATGFLFDEKAGSLRPLKLLSGLAPPACYSWVYPCDCPQNISCFKDFCEGLAYAKEVNKPILIDFTGHACVNCRKMEEHVWPEREVYKYLKDDYVLISLYVDEKIDLPADQQKEVSMKSGGTRKLRTTGNKWAHFQTENFNNNSQPYYVLLSPDGKLLNTPVPYTPDPAEYANFLQCGLDAFKNLQAEQQQLGEK
ncbi:MAG: thioredoxin family protein, partial [Bacteroidota bacterium]